jgi:hypothetical protein
MAVSDTSCNFAGPVRVDSEAAPSVRAVFIGALRTLKPVQLPSAKHNPSPSATARSRRVRGFWAVPLVIRAIRRLPIVML